MTLGVSQQRAMIYENNRLKGRERHNMNCIDEESTSGDEVEVCVAKWVDMSKGKPTSF
jgi:hypothetical protein